MNIFILLPGQAGLLSFSILFIAAAAMIYSFRKTRKIMKKIEDGGKTFAGIDALRHDLSYVKWGQDMDDAEKALIKKIADDLKKADPEEIADAYNRSMRFGNEYNKKFREKVIPDLGDKINQLRNAGPIDPTELKKLKRLANTVYYGPFLEEIKLIERKLQPEDEEKVSEVKKAALATLESTN